MGIFGAPKHRKIAQELVHIYNEEMIPEYLGYFKQVGFTRDEIQQSPEPLWRMLIYAAYDQNLMTLGFGWEWIWGCKTRKGNPPPHETLPYSLEKVQLFRLSDVQHLTEEQIRQRLKTAPLVRGTMPLLKPTPDTKVRYDRLFLRSAALAQSIYEEAKQVNGASRVLSFYQGISQTGGRNKLPGIGPVTGSKVVKYVFREIGVGHTKPSDFKEVAPKLAPEYHQSVQIQELDRVHGTGFAEKCMKSLAEDFGDPYASEALYYIHRERPDLRSRIGLPT